MSFRTPGAGGRAMRLPRRPRLLLPVAIALVAIVALFFLFSGIYTDYLWFDAIDYTPVFSGVLLTEIVLFLIGALLMVGIVGGNMLLAFRTRPMFGPAMFGGGSGADRYRMAIDPHRKLIFIVGMALLGAVRGLVRSPGSGRRGCSSSTASRSARRTRSSRWTSRSSSSTYPFIRMVLNFLFTAVILAFIAGGDHPLPVRRIPAAVARACTPSRAARVHLSVLVGVFVLLKAVAYWFDRYGLVFSERGFVHGASYTDVNAVLPGQDHPRDHRADLRRCCSSPASSGRGGMLPGVAFGLLVLSAVPDRRRLPAAGRSSSRSSPTSRRKEAAFIGRNIDATRDAYEIDDAEISHRLRAEADPSKVQVNGDASISGVRLLDPRLVSATYQQTQQHPRLLRLPRPARRRPLPRLDGKLRDPIVAVRELTGPPAGPEQLDQPATSSTPTATASWPRRATRSTPRACPTTTPRTCRSPAPGASTGSRSRASTSASTSPQYSIAGGSPSRPQELDYPETRRHRPDEHHLHRHGRRARRLVRSTGCSTPPSTSEMNILLSGDDQRRLQILYERNPRERVQKVAPFLTLDANPYPAIVDGRIVWIVDGYTTSDAYPYSQRDEPRRDDHATRSPRPRASSPSSRTTRSTTSATR